MRQLVWEKENCELKPVKPRLKIDLVSYPARAEGLVNMIFIRSIYLSDSVFIFLSNPVYFYLSLFCLCVHNEKRSSYPEGIVDGQ